MYTNYIHRIRKDLSRNFFKNSITYLIIILWNKFLKNCSSMFRSVTSQVRVHPLVKKKASFLKKILIYFYSYDFCCFLNCDFFVRVFFFIRVRIKNGRFFFVILLLYYIFFKELLPVLLNRKLVSYQITSSIRKNICVHVKTFFLICIIL